MVEETTKKRQGISFCFFLNGINVSTPYRVTFFLVCSYVIMSIHKTCTVSMRPTEAIAEGIRLMGGTHLVHLLISLAPPSPPIPCIRKGREGQIGWRNVEWGNAELAYWRLGGAEDVTSSAKEAAFGMLHQTSRGVTPDCLQCSGKSLTQVSWRKWFFIC